MRNDIVIDKMLKHIDKAIAYTNNMSYEEFISNEMVVEACIFNLSQLGELANKPDKEYRLLHNNVPWNQIYGLRNRIVHDYEGVNLKLVWEIIETDLKELRQVLLAIKAS